MSLESGSFINDLTTTNPTATDPVGQGDDHLRLIKSCVQNTLPQMGTQYGKVVSQDASTTILALQNTNSFVVTASSTTTTLLALPANASVTSGWFIDINTQATGQVTIMPASGSINGAASFSLPAGTYSRVKYHGSNVWGATKIPNGLALAQLTNLYVAGTASISGAAFFDSAVLFKSTITVSGAAVFNSGITVSGAAVIAGSLSVSGAAVLSALTVAGTATVSGTVVLTIGQIQFPATQVPNAGANVLDDYEEGTWTPTVTFATPGNLNIVYGTRTATYTKIGNLVVASFDITTTTFTHSTASGTWLITGLPFAAGARCSGALTMAGVTITSTSFGAPTVSVVSAASQLTLRCTGMNNNSAIDIDATAHTSTSLSTFNGSIPYTV